MKRLFKALMPVLFIPTYLIGMALLICSFLTVMLTSSMLLMLVFETNNALELLSEWTHNSTVIKVFVVGLIGLTTFTIINIEKREDGEKENLLARLALKIYLYSSKQKSKKGGSF